MSINYSKSTKSLVEARASSPSLASFQPPSDALTYEPHFGLNEKPFSLNADPRFVYDSPAYLTARESLFAGIRRREGLLVLTGEIGTGKTTLCRGVVRDLGRKTYSSLVPDPFASREDLLKMLLIDFGVLSIQELTAGPLRGASRTELGYLLSEFLESLTPDAFVVVIIDEAQNLSLPLIEETRILADTFGARGRMQIVFVGQPELHAKLKLPEMRQVDQRVCGYHRLAPMSRDAVAGYIQHRLRVAGGHRDQVLFPAAIIDVLHQRSGGVPRLINRLCDRALQIAFDQRAGAVSREILDAALVEVGAITLSPTWDSIIFGVPAPHAPDAVHAPHAPGSVDEHEDFKKEFSDWLERDLAPHSRTLPPLDMMFPDDAPVPEPLPAPKAVRKDVAPARVVKNDWPRDVQPETYIHRLWRTWAKRAAIALAAFAGLNVVILGGSLLSAALTPPVIPAPPDAPRAVIAGIALPEAPTFAEATVGKPAFVDATAGDPKVEAAPTEASRTAAPVAEAPLRAPAAVTRGEEFLVAVGLFSSRERADRLVDVLTQAGLPAMQRPLQLRRQQVQQIVLGPFFSRSDAARDLRRLQELGGYDDARLVTSSP